MRMGAVILHTICLIYMFCGIAIICDEYFVSSLELISSRLKISDDVAGATFMAAGGSAPELMTNFVSTFFIPSSVGVGTIVGSAAFNVLFVIGLCAYFSGFERLSLSWYPLMRDASFYIICLGILLGFLLDKEIHWYDATVLLGLYAIYVVIMKFDAQIKRRLMRMEAKFIHVTKSGKDLMVLAGMASRDTRVAPAKHPMRTNSNADAPGLSKTNTEASTTGGDNTPEDSFDKDHAIMPEVGSGLTEESKTSGRRSMVSSSTLTKEPEAATFNRRRGLDGQVSELSQQNSRRSRSVSPELSRSRSVSPEPPAPSSPRANKTASIVDPTTACETKKSEEEEEESLSWNWPEWPETRLGRIGFILLCPLRYIFAATVPDCSLKKLENFYPVTFIMSVIWIALLTYVMVWMATEIGQTIGIPDLIMGLSILAAGTSIPDAISSVIVAREGHGDMALSSSIGSNVFDITFGLPLPWLIHNIVKPFGSSVVRLSPSGNLGVQIGSLMGMVVIVILSVHIFGWSINKPLGILYFVLYFAFLTESILLECWDGSGFTCRRGNVMLDIGSGEVSSGG